MPTVAEQLRRAREAQNLTIHDVAEFTKMRTDHIAALEEGNFNVFNAQVYIRGFVRTYATMLKMNVPAIMAQLDEELSHTKKFREPPPLTDQPKNIIDYLTLLLSRINWKISGIVLIVAVVLIVAARIYLSQQPGNLEALKDIEPPLYQSTQSVVGDTLPLPSPATPRR